MTAQVSPSAKPYVKRGKNDAVDAEAICEAMSRPGMRFASIKSGDQQATLMLHKTCELLVKQQTMSIRGVPELHRDANSLAISTAPNSRFLSHTPSRGQRAAAT